MKTDEAVLDRHLNRTGDGSAEVMMCPSHISDETDQSHCKSQRIKRAMNDL